MTGNFLNIWYFNMILADMKKSLSVVHPYTGSNIQQGLPTMVTPYSRGYKKIKINFDVYYYLSKIYSHNQLAITKNQFRKHFLWNWDRKRLKKWISIFHQNLKYSQFEHIFSDFRGRGFSGLSPNTFSSAMHTGHYEMGPNCKLEWALFFDTLCPQCNLLEISEKST